MKKVWKLLRVLLLLFFGSSIGAVILFRFVPVPVTPLMIIRAVNAQGTDTQKERERHWQHQWVSYDEISSWMPRAVVASEDGRFYEHHGFDFKEIQNAIDEGKAGKRQRGASTISQQTAKNVFLWPGPSWVRKGLEAYFTVLIELFWSKERIMEVYLNSIEMGAGIYGVEAASQHYFGCTAKELSKPRAALIALCLPSPLKRDPAHPSSYMRRRQRTIMRYM
jgi:monofunctional biosynthetic peptidoglycan transglycosylase